MSKLAYVRVSTDPQHTDRQEAMAERYGVDKVFVEKASGKNTDRPKLKALLDYMREGDTLYIESYSRLARNTRDLLALIETITAKGVTLISEKEGFDTSTPHGKLMLTIFAGLAQFERELTVQRIHEGLAAARAKGRTGGRRTVKRPADFLSVMYDQHRGHLSVADACARLGLSRSKYFEFKKQAMA